MRQTGRHRPEAGRTHQGRHPARAGRILLTAVTAVTPMTTALPSISAGSPSPSSTRPEVTSATPPEPQPLRFHGGAVRVLAVATRRPVALAPPVRLRGAPAATAARPSLPAGPTTWPALNVAIARIPGYRPGRVRWVVGSVAGHWGATDWYHATLYVSPRAPLGYLYDVAVHEWSHELSVLDYGGDVDAATTAMNAYFGGSGLAGAERAADCMSVLDGATWTHYTSCPDAGWRAGARRLLEGRRV